MKGDLVTANYVFAHGLEIRFHQESLRIDNHFGVKKPDISWRYIDPNDHAHVWVGDELPTLKEVVTGKTWVGDEYDGMEVDITEYRCRVCDAVVEPKYTVSYEPNYVAGPPEYTLAIKPSIMESEYPIPQDDVGPLIDILRRIFDRG